MYNHRQLIADEATLRKLQNDHGVACGAFILFFPRASAAGSYWVRLKLETETAELDAKLRIANFRQVAANLRNGIPQAPAVMNLMNIFLAAHSANQPMSQYRIMRRLGTSQT